MGAAVWHSTLGAYKINTNGDGPDNTITRAELAAIFCTVAQRLPRTDEGVIFTDSQAAIHLLHRAVHKPHTLEGHLHKELLLNTAQILVERANDTWGTPDLVDVFGPGGGRVIAALWPAAGLPMLHLSVYWCCCTLHLRKTMKYLSFRELKVRGKQDVYG